MNKEGFTNEDKMDVVNTLSKNYKINADCFLRNAICYFRVLQLLKEGERIGITSHTKDYSASLSIHLKINTKEEISEIKKLAEQGLVYGIGGDEGAD